MKPNAITLTCCLTAILIVFLLVACQPKAEQQSQADDLKGFTAIANPERVTHNTFSMVKPREWKEVQYTNNILIYLPPESGINDSSAEKYSMIVGFLPENNTLSLKELTDMDMAKSKETLPALEIIGDYEPVGVGQLDGLKLRFRIKVQDKTIESTQLRTMQGNRIYAFSQQCLEGGCKYTDIFNEMIGSFEWRNP
ncbi:MAG: hypothetical protein V1866_03790 [archaeon]